MESTQEIFDVIRRGDAPRLTALLAGNRSLANARDERGHSAVLLAQYHHRSELVTLLLAAGPELDIFDAASVGQSGRVAELLDQDPALLHAYSGDGFFPLGLAAFFGHTGTVELLLARGADVAQVARNPMRIQALHAAATGSLPVVKLLVAAGAPVDARQREGWTPLHEAVNRNDLAMIQYLVAHGADPRQQNDEGKSAIALAAEKGFAEAGELLTAGGEKGLNARA